MNDLYQPLTDLELDRLDRFLLDRVDEDAVSPGDDEGVLNVSELDGLLTAVVTGPVMIPPSRWMPAVWGEFEPTWKDARAFERVFGLMMRHMNSIAVLLQEEPEAFEPLALEHVRDGERITLLDSWAWGYLRGVELALDAWAEGGRVVEEALEPIRILGSETTDDPGRPDPGSPDAGSPDPAARLEHASATLPAAVLALHAFWLERRGDEPAAEAPAPIRREGPRIGRNDPCPCGSGRKFKKCCLH